MLNQEFLIGHNVASNPSICKIQKGADSEKSEFLKSANYYKHFDFNFERDTYIRAYI